MNIEMDVLPDKLKQVIDARGLNCPTPLILTKKELLKIKEGEQIRVIVDNAAARNNIERFVSDNHASAECRVENGVFTLTITRIKGRKKVISREQDEYKLFPPRGKHIFVFKNDRIADDELGDMLIKGFFETMKELDLLPDKIIFYHKAINLVLEGSPCLENIRHLESLGVEMLVCGNCIEYYKVKEKIGAGTISNAYEILTALSNAHHIITP